MSIPSVPASKTRLLEAAAELIQVQGYAATTVDEICHRAGVTKGSFFHHFRSKDQLAIASAAHWAAANAAALATAPHRRARDPLERLLGWVEFQRGLLSAPAPPAFACLLGTLSQETYATHPDIRAACDRELTSQIAELMLDIDAAKQRYVPDAPWSAESIGYFLQALLQGSFVFAKAKSSSEVARANLAHLRDYLLALFGQRMDPPRAADGKSEAAT